MWHNELGRNAWSPENSARYYISYAIRYLTQKRVHTQSYITN